MDGDHADLVAVVHLRRGARGEEQSRHHAGDARLHRGVVDADAVAVPEAVLIVVAEEEVWLAVGGIVLDLVEELAKFRGVEFVDVGYLEVHGELDLVVVLAVHLGELEDVGFVGFADEDGVAGIFVDDLAHLAQHVVNFGEVVGVFVLDVRVAEGVEAGLDGVVVEVGVFEEARDGVDAEAVDPFVHPEAEDVHHGLHDFWVAPVEVGLLDVEVVVVVLLRGGRPTPTRSDRTSSASCLEGWVCRRRCSPLGRARCTSRVWDCAGGARLLEPCALVGGVVGNVVHDDADVAALGLRGHVLEVGHGAVLRIDGL